ncbi:MFS transporter [Lichenifustis flavocetrariae]|uniref:MFS transporter n=1 Tax=Lichenifustis flavocetrariae TaxID=2949735 RepID=A0AA41YU89_9HYPH|nr:MFS transporter [Lichenifustis flavocetrariae]MCW6506958.1 MFS transporter [Lichenifustis flavocetrariae]
MAQIQPSTLSKMKWRLLPFLLASYLVAYLDRVNVGVAALQMNQDLALSPTAYAVGSGIFFLGYFVFELPSNWLLERVGARVWIARIMITWGLLACATALTWNAASFSVVRFLLGFAEAGFLPGIVFYLGRWFPARERALVMSTFFLGVPLSFVLGAPLSGALLNLGGIFGIAGWKWLFILEGAPAIVLGILCLFVLSDRPSEAAWLDADERTALASVLSAEEKARAGAASTSFFAALREPGVWAFGLAYMGVNMGIYGIGLWLPQIIKQVGFTDFVTTLLSALPYVVAAVVMVLWARHSDQTGERRWHAVLPCIACSVGLGGSAVLGNPLLAYAALTLAAVGIMTSMANFWALPTGALAGSAAAGGIALVNSVGNLGGFGGSYLVGYLRQSSHGFQSSLLFLSVCPLIAAAILYVMAGWRRGAGSPAAAPTPVGEPV